MKTFFSALFVPRKYKDSMLNVPTVLMSLFFGGECTKKFQMNLGIDDSSYECSLFGGTHYVFTLKWNNVTLVKQVWLNLLWTDDKKTNVFSLFPHIAGETLTTSESSQHAAFKTLSAQNVIKSIII